MTKKRGKHTKSALYMYAFGAGPKTIYSKLG